MIRKSLGTFSFCLIGCIALMLVPAISHGDEYGEKSVTICPYKIILNVPCKAESQDIQAVVRFDPSASGALLEASTVKMFVVKEDDEIEIAVAEYMRYCYDDDNLLCTFNRSVIQKAVQSMANSIVTVKIKGWLPGSDLNSPEDFWGTDDVEIVSPSKKPS
jgi:hypothetical protein